MSEGFGASEKLIQAGDRAREEIENNEANNQVDEENAFCQCADGGICSGGHV